jgi:GLPGLI family protein
MNFKAGIKLLAFFVLLFSNVKAQYVHSGKITFERRTNLMKRFNDPRMRRMINEDNKIKNEGFYLYFNDTASVFKPIPNDKPDETSWMTTKNSYQQNLSNGKQLTVLALFGQNVYIVDSLPVRNWKVTDSKRTICGYECRTAIY